MHAALPFLIRQYDFNLAYATALTCDLDNAQMVHVPTKGLVNHPAFTIGHLVTGSAMVAQDMGGCYEIPVGWKELFERKGPADKRFPEAGVPYPAIALLITELERQHNKVKKLAVTVSEEKLGEPAHWRFQSYMPTLLDSVFFMCVNHESMHLGQLAAWRRAMNLPPVLNTL